MDKLQVFIQLLTDPENQPHQFVGQPELLEHHFKNLLSEDKPRVLGIHGEHCPHCLNGACECDCHICKPEESTPEKKEEKE